MALVLTDQERALLQVVSLADIPEQLRNNPEVVMGKFFELIELGQADKTTEIVRRLNKRKQALQTAHNNVDREAAASKTRFLSDIAEVDALIAKIQAGDGT